MSTIELLSICLLFVWPVLLVGGVSGGEPAGLAADGGAAGRPVAAGRQVAIGRPLAAANCSGQAVPTLTQQLLPHCRVCSKRGWGVQLLTYFDVIFQYISIQYSKLDFWGKKSNISIQYSLYIFKWQNTCFVSSNLDIV